MINKADCKAVLFNPRKNNKALFKIVKFPIKISENKILFKFLLEQDFIFTHDVRT